MPSAAPEAAKARCRQLGGKLLFLSSRGIFLVLQRGEDLLRDLAFLPAPLFASLEATTRSLDLLVTAASSGWSGARDDTVHFGVKFQLPSLTLAA